MRNLLNIAEIFCYGVAVYVLFNGGGAGYWIMFSGGLFLSFIKKFFK